jgi:hypothetical protein
VAVLELHAEGGVGEDFGDGPHHLNRVARQTTLQYSGP